MNKLSEIRKDLSYQNRTARIAANKLDLVDLDLDKQGPCARVSWGAPQWRRASARRARAGAAKYSVSNTSI